MNLREIAHALNGDVQGRQVLAPGPNHSRLDRSLSVRLAPGMPGGFVVTSFADDPFDLCRDYVASRLGLPHDFWRTKGQGSSRPAPVFSVPDGRAADDTAKIARAVAIWNEAVDAHGTVVELYLASRGLTLPDGAGAIRFHASCPWKDHALNRTIYIPAMISAMRQVEGDALTAVHRTWLTREGAKVDRRMLGRAAGAAVKIDAAISDLVVGEGVETSLAARQMGFRPVWAAGSTSNIAALPVLANVGCLTLLGEAGVASERAIGTCSDTWLAADREVVVIHPTVGSDMNDALRAFA